MLNQVWKVPNGTRSLNALTPARTLATIKQFMMPGIGVRTFLYEGI